MIKQATLNPKIRDYVLSESELPVLLVAKLAQFYSYLPDKVELMKSASVMELFPRADEESESHHLNLSEQIEQSFPNLVSAHAEFVKYTCFINLIAETIQVEPKMSN